VCDQKDWLKNETSVGMARVKVQGYAQPPCIADGKLMAKILIMTIQVNLCVLLQVSF